MKILVFIPARGGSKGIPGKNLIELNNKPLIKYTLETVNQIIKNNEYEWIPFVSTDDDEIAAVGKEYGAKIIKRPSSLSQDNSPEWLAWKHAIKYVFDNDFFV